MGSIRQRKVRSRERTDGRRQFLAYLPPEVILDLKKAALDEEKHAYEIVETAVKTWLAKHRKKSKD